MEGRREELNWRKPKEHQGLSKRKEMHLRCGLTVSKKPGVNRGLPRQFSAARKGVLEESLLAAFVGNQDLGPADVDMACLSHDDAVKVLKEFLDSLSSVLPDLVHSVQIHGISEDGVDILMKSTHKQLTIGWQLKSQYDHQQAGFQSSVLSQVMRSKKFDCDRFVLVLCSDPTEHKNRILALIREISQSEPDYVRIVLPEDFLRILRKENWIALRGRAVSRLLGSGPGPTGVAQSIQDADPLTPRIDTSRPVSLMPNAQNLYDAGLKFVIEHNYFKAEERFEASLHIEPSAACYNALGATQLLREDYVLGMVNLMSGLKKFPDDPSLLNNVSIALMRMGLVEDSVEYSRKCHKADPKNPWILMLCVKALVRGGKPKEALDLALQFQRHGGILVPEINLTLANAALDTGNVLLSNEFYRTYSEMHPEDYRGYWGIAICARRNGKHHEAVELCKRAAELEPMSAAVLFELANDLRDAGITDESMATFKKARDLAPNSVPITGNYANLMRDLGRLAEAIEIYDKLALLSPGDPLVWENRGQCLRRLGRADESVESYKAALALVKEPSGALLNSAGLAMIEGHRLSEAKRLLDRSVKLDPSNWMPHSNLATIYCSLANFEREAEELEKSIEFGGTNESEYTRLASSYIRLGKSDKAEKAVDSALDLNPRFAPALGTKGLVLMRQGRRQEAIVFLRKSKELDPSLAFVTYWLDHINDIPCEF
jgi:tetratricopeptide (TPR) repeat protein